MRSEIHHVGSAGSYVALHRPAREGGLAVLMCPPFGWEEMCSHRGRWAWAQAIAAAGHGCARLDLPGTGDSPGAVAQRTLPAWTAAVQETAAWLAQTTGALRIAVLGIGLGGLVAASAAQAGAAIDDLLLWGLPRRGRTLVRAMRAHSAVIAARYPEDARDSHGDVLDFAGFGLPLTTVAELEAITLDGAVLGAHPGRRVLLLGRDGAGPDARLAADLRGAGAAVTEAGGEEYELLLGHPQQAAAPQEAIAASLEWCHEAPLPAQRPPSVAAAPTGAPAAHLSSAPPVAETAFAFDGAAAGAFGLLTPARGDGLAAVWLNAGALHHVGPNRAWVQAARHWAARGIPAVRVDLPDLGEAEGELPRPRSDASFYDPIRVQQTVAVLEQLAAAGIGERFVVGGLCSGAYWALHAALRQPRVAELILINLYAVVYSDELVAERDTAQSLDALGSRAWRKLLRGQVSATQIADGLRAISPGRVRRGASQPVARAQGPAIEAALDRLRAQGTGTTLVFSSGEGLLDQLTRLAILDRAPARWPGLTVQTLPSRDHMLRAPWAQALLQAALDEAMARALGVARAA